MSNHCGFFKIGHCRHRAQQQQQRKKSIVHFCYICHQILKLFFYLLFSDIWQLPGFSREMLNVFGDGGSGGIGDGGGGDAADTGPPGTMVLHSATFECRDCGKHYRHSNNLHRHRRFECGKEPQFMCPYCKYKAKLKDNLKKHVVYKHKAKF